VAELLSKNNLDIFVSSTLIFDVDLDQNNADDRKTVQEYFGLYLKHIELSAVELWQKKTILDP